MKELQIASKNSIILKAGTFSLLSYIYICYENKYQLASYFSKYLHNPYHYNLEYLADFIKNLLLMKKYNEAESLVMYSAGHETNSYFKAQILIFKGIIQEKKYHNYKLAKQYFNYRVNDLAIFGSYGREYAAYSYFGLSRICGSEGDNESRKIYRKQAMKLADLKKNLIKFTWFKNV